MLPDIVLLSALAAREERAWLWAWGVTFLIGAVCGFVLNGAYWLAVLG